MTSESDAPVSDVMETELLLERVAEGDVEALGCVLEGQRNYLRRLLELRMDDELRSRIDPSDVIQETQLAASRRIDDFLKRRPISFKLWLRRKAIEKLIEFQRKHVYAAKRSVRREVRLFEGSSLAAVAQSLAQRPSELMQRRELQDQTNQAIRQLGETDREILLLRHGEDLTNAEVAELLEISAEAASKRYGRAILRLRTILGQLGATLRS